MGFFVDGPFRYDLFDWKLLYSLTLIILTLFH